MRVKLPASTSSTETKMKTTGNLISDDDDLRRNLFAVHGDAADPSIRLRKTMGMGVKTIWSWSFLIYLRGSPTLDTFPAPCPQFP